MVGISKGTKPRLGKPRKSKAGTLLLKARKKKGLSLRNVEDRIGVSFSAIAHIETGREVPSVRTCYLLAKYYRIPFMKLVRAVVKDDL